MFQMVGWIGVKKPVGAARNVESLCDYLWFLNVLWHY